VHRWSASLPFVQRIINASVESSIGVNPASLLFGNAINLDRGIISPLSLQLHSQQQSQTNDNNNSHHSKLSEWSADMLKLQMAVIEAAKETQLVNDSFHIANSKTTRITEFENNSYVLVKYRDGLPNKLNTNLKGPFKVLSHIGPTYTIENLVTGKHENYHVTQLRTFIFDAHKQDPTEYANRDYFATVVESIISHEPVKDNYKKQKLSELKFHVQWKDLPHEFDRILPWKELRNNPKLHKYLADNPPLKRFIPKEFKNEYKN
jgi:hypothetical protein